MGRASFLASVHWQTKYQTLLSLVTIEIVIQIGRSLGNFLDICFGDVGDFGLRFRTAETKSMRTVSYLRRRKDLPLVGTFRHFGW